MQEDLFAQPSAPAPSLFFALLPGQADQALLDQSLGSHVRRLGPLTPIPVAKRHVTLLYLGQPLDEQIPSLVRAAHRAAGALQEESFVLTLDQLAVFGRNAVVLAASQTPKALASLEARLRAGAILNRLLLAKPATLHPHLTLGYNDDRRAPAETCPPVRLAFADFVLLRGGKRDAYTELGRWSLD